MVASVALFPDENEEKLAPSSDCKAPVSQSLPLGMVYEKKAKRVGQELRESEDDAVDKDVELKLVQDEGGSKELDSQGDVEED
jgi:hypothetical protein